MLARLSRRLRHALVVGGLVAAGCTGKERSSGTNLGAGGSGGATGTIGGSGATAGGSMGNSGGAGAGTAGGSAGNREAASGATAGTSTANSGGAGASTAGGSAGNPGSAGGATAGTSMANSGGAGVSTAGGSAGSSADGGAGTAGTTNLVANGDFSQAAAHWDIRVGASATTDYTITGGLLCLTVPASKSATIGWPAPGEQGLNLAGSYTLSFQASASAAISFADRGGLAVARYTQYFNHPQTIGSSLTTITDPVTVNATNAGFAFVIATTTGPTKVCVDNISLTKN